MRRSSVRQERCAHTTKNRTEVLCPRVTQAAMIAAASFGLRRSGTFATATSGAAYWAASVRHGPPWPLPVNAPKSIFQNSNPIQGRELSGLLSLHKTPNRGENLEIFASPSYRRGHDHDSFGPGFPALLPCS